jgi:hypothetical protein
VQTDVISAQAAAPEAPRSRSRWEARVAIVTLLVFGLALSAVLLFALETSTPVGTSITTVSPVVHHGPPVYPIGIPESLEPSGLGPPLPTALAGYHRVYTTDFSGEVLPPGWEAFTGAPGGDNQAQFAANHVRVNNGMLQLFTTMNPTSGKSGGLAATGRLGGAASTAIWTSGGLCQCGRPMTYGAFFVRSRITGPGPNEVELLWPADNHWPPEIDFNESGSRWAATSGTVHFGSSAATDHFIQQNFFPIDLARWHTWGVVWTPTSITYTVDGYQWGTTLRTPGTIPRLAMTLDLQQRPSCTSGLACPNQNQSMLVDWVAEYIRNHP